jgi:hypothetical protein
VMGPWLRTPFQGADTMVWLATARPPLEVNGRFWLDRHRRWPVKLPWTRTSPDDADRLWRWVADRAGVAPTAPGAEVGGDHPGRPSASNGGDDAATR